MSFIRGLVSQWRLTALVVLALGGLYGTLASFARIYDIRLVGLDVMEAVRLLGESYLILVATVAVLSLTVVGLSVSVWRLTNRVKQLQRV